MKSSPFIFVVGFAALALTLFSGYLHGRIRHSWGMGEDLGPRAEKLHDLPESVGAWELKQTEDVGKATRRLLELAGHHHGVYENTTTGEVVQVVVLLGPSGPIAVHSPEICYSSKDYKVLERRKQMSLKIDGEKRSTLWGLTFDSKNNDGSMLRVAYGWTTDGDWAAPGSARRAFAGEPYLYKIQFVSTMARNSKLDEHDPVEAFGKEFISMLHEEVF